jgi:hypothetical protein
MRGCGEDALPLFTLLLHCRLGVEKMIYLDKIPCESATIEKRTVKQPTAILFSSTLITTKQYYQLNYQLNIRKDSAQIRS